VALTEERYAGDPGLRGFSRSLVSGSELRTGRPVFTVFWSTIS
jgi:hypothetical protein